MPTLILVLALMLSSAADAHTTSASNAAGEWLLIALLFVVGAWYAWGYWRVRVESRGGRGMLAKQALMFYSGWAVMAGSLLTPLHELGGRSFTAHMIEHELLMLLAAPLIAWSRPIGVLLWAFDARTRQALASVGHRRWFANAWSSISTPLAASLLQAVAMWAWHAPTLFNAALLSEGWHAAQHLSFVFSAVLIWWSLNTVALRERSPGVAAFWLFFTSIHSGFLGALMTFAQSPWYPRYVELGLTGAGGLTPLEDQQLAGIIMWIPGGVVHALVALVYLARWLKLPRPAWPIATVAIALLMFPHRPAQADTLYVSDEDLNLIHVFDTHTSTLMTQIKVGLRPRGMALDEVADILYVAVSNDNRIDVVDLKAHRVTGTLPSGPDPEVIVLHPDRKRIYVANEADNLASVIDVPARKIIAEVPIGTEPEGMAVSPDGRHVLATSEASSMAHFIDISGPPNQPVLVNNVLVDTRPRYAKFSTDSSRVWVSSEVRGTVAVFDTKTQKRLGKVDFERSDLPGDTKQAVGIELTRDGRRAFVALGRGNQVAEVNPETFEIVRSFPAGFRVWNIALSPDETTLYAIGGLSADLTIIDLQSNQVTATHKLGGKPWGIVAR